MKTTIAMFFFLLFASTVFARVHIKYLVPGNQLAEWKDDFDKLERDEKGMSYESMHNGILFTGYVTGVAEVALINGVICTEDGVIRRQLYLVVANYITAHPETWSRPGAAIVTRALKESFPCKQK